MIQPKIRIPAIILYFVLATIAFALKEETLYHYFIHVIRSIWYIGLVEFVLSDKFRRKKLVLYEDDFAIMIGEKVEAAYEYCNLHKLWKADY